MKQWLTVLYAFLVMTAPAPALALKNPAAVYCTALGYEYQVERTAQGDFGYCVLPSGEKVDAWKFLLGQTATEQNYCARQGYANKIVHNPMTCLVFLTDSCLVCVLDDGREVEVTELMGLSFSETTCGDGVCGIPETYVSCPEDCPKR
jgi:putative hemolysin